MLELERILEQEIREAIFGSYPLDWKEDSITHDLMKRLRSRLRDVTILGTRFPVHLH